jgi:uracil-DNA glycosylase family 4
VRLKEHLLAVAEELQRLKGEGVTSVAVEDETIDSLRAIAGPVKNPSAPAAAAPAAPPVVKQALDVPSFVSKPAPPPRTSEPETLPPAEVELPSGTKREQFDWLVAQVTGNPGCIKHVRPGKKVVVGVGNLDAKIMFVGEAPGAEEEIQGEPFVGPAGQLLNKMIKAMGIERSDVYIGNIMNWRPQVETPHGGEQIGNRPPTAGEMAFCIPYLRAQIAIVKPEVLVALGGTAAKGLLGADAVPTIGAVKGRWHDFAGTPLMITYHPSYLLRNQSNRSKRSVWEDLMLVMERVGLPISAKQRGFFL